MIVVAGTIVIDPANLGAAKEAIDALQDATRSEEGNISYEFWLSLTEPGALHVFEEWADEDALNLHMGTDHMAAFLTAATGFGITATELNRYDVSDKTRFM